MSVFATRSGPGSSLERCRSFGVGCPCCSCFHNGPIPEGCETRPVVFRVGCSTHIARYLYSYLEPCPPSTTIEQRIRGEGGREARKEARTLARAGRPRGFLGLAVASTSRGVKGRFETQNPTLPDDGTKTRSKERLKDHFPPTRARGRRDLGRGPASTSAFSQAVKLAILKALGSVGLPCFEYSPAGYEYSTLEVIPDS